MRYSVGFQDKLSGKELEEKIARIREQNEKIKQRRLVSSFVVLKPDIFLN